MRGRRTWFRLVKSMEPRSPCREPGCPQCGLLSGFRLEVSWWLAMVRRGNSCKERLDLG